MRVLELEGGIATSYTSKLLADEGADVIKVEPLEGDPLRDEERPVQGIKSLANNGLFLALNVNKRSVSLDFADQNSLTQLLDWAEVVILGASNLRFSQNRLDAKSLLEDRPHLVVMSISPFGLDGPPSGGS